MVYNNKGIKIMKITNKQLKQIIKEEIQNLLLEIGEEEGITPETAQALRKCWVHLMLSSYGAGLFRGKRIANSSSSENTNEVNAKNMTQEAMDYYFDDYTQGSIVYENLSREAIATVSMPNR